jgi:ADP-heptose:LPS heptosyltransferase
MMASVNSILIIVLDNLGDTVMATPLIAALKSLNTNVKVGFWVKEYAADLFKNQAGIAHVHASDPFWDTSPGRAKGSFFRFLKTLKEIRGVSYDAALILNTEWRRSLSALVTGIPVRVGYARRHSTPFLTNAYPYQPGHIVDDHLRLLSAWTGKQTTNYFPELSVEKRDVTKTIVMHPFSGDPERKNWPIVSWKELIEKLSHSLPGYSFTIVGSKNDEAQMAQLKTNDRVSLFIDRSLPEVLSRLAEAKLFVGGDSGPGHMAAAVGTPVLSLFGSFNPDRCRPMGKNKTALIQKNPLKDLPATTVEEKIRELL